MLFNITSGGMYTKTVSGYFNAPWAYQRDRENMEKYGTCDLDEIERIEAFAEKTVEKRADELSYIKAEARFDAIKDKFELDIIRKTEEAFLIKKGQAALCLLSLCQ